MNSFLLLSVRRHWLTLWECKHLIRFIRLARSDDEFDWRAPKWVRKSVRRSLYWAVCRMSVESPAYLVLGVLCSIPAIFILVWRLVGRVAALAGVTL